MNEYIRKAFSLPHSSSLSYWSSIADCSVGFFKDVFAGLKKKVDEDPLNADCSLVCDAMSIKSSTSYNKVTGSFEGFVDFGKDIVVDDEIAIDALVFMLVSLRKSWKYPTRYILTSKAVDATNLHCFLSQALQYSAEHNLNVYTVTWKAQASTYRL